MSTDITSSSAVAKRPRVAVSNFNTKRRAQSFIVSYILHIYHCVQLNSVLLSSA